MIETSKKVFRQIEDFRFQIWDTFQRYNDQKVND